MDANLSPKLVPQLASEGWDALHVAADFGCGRAADEEVMALALRLGRVVVTQDGDFHRMLAASGETQPSVMRLRVQTLELPEQIAPMIAAAAERHHLLLRAGAIVTVDEASSRARALPVGRGV